jgi:hypothetical protein
MFDDDLDHYLDEHGRDCFVGGQPLRGILDKADDSMPYDGANVQTNVWNLTVKTAAVTALQIKFKTVIGIDVRSFEVRNLEELDDGAFTLLKVRKL